MNAGYLQKKDSWCARDQAIVILTLHRKLTSQGIQKCHLRGNGLLLLCSVLLKINSLNDFF